MPGRALAIDRVYLDRVYRRLPRCYRSAGVRRDSRNGRRELVQGVPSQYPTRRVRHVGGTQGTRGE